MRWRRSTVGALLAVGGLAVASVAGNAYAQGTNVDGSYVGTIGAEGGFGYEGSGVNVYMNILGSDGMFRVTIEDDRLIGSWAMSGETLVTGAVGGSGALSGGGSFDAAGTVVGTMSNANIVGTNTYQSSVTVNVGGFARTDRSSGSEDILEPITDLRIVCGVLVARYDQEISEDIEEIDGFEEALNGYIVARLEGPSALEEQIEALGADIREWAGNAGVASSADEIVAAGLAIMEQVEDLNAAIDAEQQCPPDPTFVNELTLAAQDALRAILVFFPGEIGYDDVVLALESGAIGAGSAYPEEAAAIQAAMEADLQDQFVTAESQDPLDVDALGRVAFAAQALGMDSLTSSSGVAWTPQEIVIVTGAEA